MNCEVQQSIPIPYPQQAWPSLASIQVSCLVLGSVPARRAANACGDRLLIFFVVVFERFFFGPLNGSETPLASPLTTTAGGGCHPGTRIHVYIFGCDSSRQQLALFGLVRVS